MTAFAYTLSLSAADYKTLKWLADRGYDGGLIEHCDDIDVTLPGGKHVQGVSKSKLAVNDGTIHMRFTEPSARAIEMARAFLACCGSTTLESAAHAFLAKIV